MQMEADVINIVMSVLKYVVFAIRDHVAALVIIRKSSMFIVPLTMYGTMTVSSTGKYVDLMVVLMKTNMPLLIREVHI